MSHRPLVHDIVRTEKERSRPLSDRQHIQSEHGRQPAIFFDRDGVLVRSEVRDGRPYAVRRLEDFEILPDVPAALTVLKAAGFRLVVATNQPDVAQGQVSREIIEAMHQCLRAVLPLDAIEVCFHVEADCCDCRKPKPGMLLAAAEAWSIDLASSYMIGDRWRDIDAGKAAGCRTVLIDRHYHEALRAQPDFIVESIADAARAILQDGSE